MMRVYRCTVLADGEKIEATGWNCRKKITLIECGPEWSAFEARAEAVRHASESGAVNPRCVLIVRLVDVEEQSAAIAREALVLAARRPA
jgi:hypothetical protein